MFFIIINFINSFNHNQIQFTTKIIILCIVYFVDRKGFDKKKDSVENVCVYWMCKNDVRLVFNNLFFHVFVCM